MTKVGELTMSETLNVVDHPLVTDKLSQLRDVGTDMARFRSLMHEVSFMLGYEALRDWPMIKKPVETPLTTFNAPVREPQSLSVISILRAGNGFLDGLLALERTAKVGFVGLKRNEDTLEPEQYYLNLPDVSEGVTILCDPMLATGGSSSHAVSLVKEQGAKDLKFICLLASPEGVARFSEDHPDVPIYTASLDDHLNEKGYIVPGLGDAGDRLYGT